MVVELSRGAWARGAKGCMSFFLGVKRKSVSPCDAAFVTVLKFWTCWG